MTISRGQLFVLSQAWMAAVEEFERNFCLLMGATADQGPRVIQRLKLFIAVKQPQLGTRVSRKLASTRLHLPLRSLSLTGRGPAAEKSR